jgi:hypothetical protein
MNKRPNASFPPLSTPPIPKAQVQHKQGSKERPGLQIISLVVATAIAAFLFFGNLARTNAVGLYFPSSGIVESKDVENGSWLVQVTITRDFGKNKKNIETMWRPVSEAAYNEFEVGKTFTTDEILKDIK